MTEYQKRKLKRNYSGLFTIGGSLVLFALLAGFGGDITFVELISW